MLKVLIFDDQCDTSHTQLYKERLTNMFIDLANFDIVWGKDTNYIYNNGKYNIKIEIYDVSNPENYLLHREDVLKGFNEIYNKQESEKTQMKNYICINGKQTELTDEQLKQLGIEVEKKCKTPFDRVGVGDVYSFITGLKEDIVNKTEANDRLDKNFYENYNYFNNEKFANQLRLHELLNRKLLKFSYENGWSDSLWENNNVYKNTIYKDMSSNEYRTYSWCITKEQGTFFISKEIAQRAIDEIVLPFEKEHPEFRW